MDSALPEITSVAIDAVFTTLSTMEVGLDADPLQYGPKRLNGKVAGARGMLTDTESLFLRVSQWLQKYRAAHRTMQTTLDLDKKNLLANDPEVRSGHNISDRDAIASMKLREEVRALARIEQTVADLEALLTVIKAKRTDLKDVQGRIRDQIKLCQEEIGLGGRWGSKPVPGREAPDLESSPDVDKKTLKDLHEMFTGTGVSEPDLAAVAPLPEVEPAPQEGATTESLGSEGDDSDSDAYLAAIASPKETATPLQNIDQLLNDLDL